MADLLLADHLFTMSCFSCLYKFVQFTYNVLHLVISLEIVYNRKYHYGSPNIGSRMFYKATYEYGFTKNSCIYIFDSQVGT